MGKIAPRAKGGHLREMSWRRPNGRRSYQGPSVDLETSSSKEPSLLLSDPRDLWRVPHHGIAGVSQERALSGAEEIGTRSELCPLPRLDGDRHPAAGVAGTDLLGLSSGAPDRERSPGHLESGRLRPEEMGRNI